LAEKLVDEPVAALEKPSAEAVPNTEPDKAKGKKATGKSSGKMEARLEFLSRMYESKQTEEDEEETQ